MKNIISKNPADYDDSKENKNIGDNYFYDIICDSFYCKDYYFYPFFNNFSYNNDDNNFFH